MHKIFVEPENIMLNQIEITGENLNHIKNVLRCQKNEKIEIASLQDVSRCV